LDVHTPSPWAFSPNDIVGDLRRPYVFSLPSPSVADVKMMQSPLPPSLPSPLSPAPSLLGVPSMAPLPRSSPPPSSSPLLLDAPSKASLASPPTPFDAHKVALRRSPNKVWSTGASAATAAVLLLLITSAIYARRRWVGKGQKRRSSSAPPPASCDGLSVPGTGPLPTLEIPVAGKRDVVRICHPESATQLSVTQRVVYV